MLVLNTGIFPPGIRIENLSLKDWQKVMHIGCGAGFGMSGSSLHGVERGAHLEQEGDGGVPQVMEADIGKPVVLDQFLELVVETVLVQWGIDRAGEDQVVLLPTVSCCNLDLFLLEAVFFQFFEDALTQFDLSASSFGLGGYQANTFMFHSLELSLDQEYTLVPIQVSPFQTEQFSLAHPDKGFGLSLTLSAVKEIRNPGLRFLISILLFSFQPWRYNTSLRLTLTCLGMRVSATAALFMALRIVLADWATNPE